MLVFWFFFGCGSGAFLHERVLNLVLCVPGDHEHITVFVVAEGLEGFSDVEHGLSEVITHHLILPFFLVFSFLEFEVLAVSFSELTFRFK